jgi:hypothetical protein
MIKLSMQSPAAPSYPQLFTVPDLFYSTLFLNALNLCSSFSVRNQVLHPHEITGKIKVMCILIFIFLSSKEEHNTGLNGSRYSQSSVSC